MKQEDAVYLRLPIGWERRPVMIKVLEKDKDAFIQLFSSLINGMVGVYRTNNLNSAELKTNSLKTPISEFEKLDFNTGKCPFCSGNLTSTRIWRRNMARLS